MEYSYQNSVIAQILEAIINASTYEGETGSNIADILLSILNETPYEGEANSVLAELFLELKAKIEGDPFTPYEGTYSGHIAEILLSILNETEYTAEPQSRIAELLLQLKEELEAYTEVTKSGAIANFTTNVSKPLVNLTAYFKATQEAGTPTPQSPKAISGVSAVNVVHCHKNLYQYDESKVTTGTTSGGTTCSYLPLGLKGACTLTFSASLKSGEEPTAQFINIGKMKNGIITVLQSFIQGANLFERALPFNEGDEVVLVSASESTYAITSSLPKYDIQIEVGSSSSEFESYSGSTALINLGGTYYGGYVTQDKDGKRELIVTWCDITDLGSLNWGALNDGRAICNPSDMSIVPLSSIIGNILSDCYKPDTHNNVWNRITDNTIAVTNNPNAKMVLYDSNLGTKTSEEVKAYLSGKSVIYGLAEPFTVTLPDGEPITAFNGVNNIYNDSGDTSVTYLYKGEPPLQSPLGFGLGSSNSAPEEDTPIEDTPIEETENSEEEA